MKPIHTVGELIYYIDEHYANPAALNSREREGWRSISSEEIVKDVKRLTYALVNMGVKKGDRVGILAPPSPMWTIVDLAIIMAGGISVPLFSQISDQNFVYEIAQADVKTMFVEGNDQWRMYANHRHIFEKVIGLDDHKEAWNALNIRTVLEEGDKLWHENPKLFRQLAEAQQTDDVITIIYTSGSTGVPKGAELTHKALFHLIDKEAFGWSSDNDRYLSVLPLAHIFARQLNFIILAWGISIYYLNDLAQMANVCKEIRPTIMIVVPRLLEKMYSRMVAGLQKSKGLKRKIGDWAFNMAQEEHPSWFKRCFLMPIADLLVYSKIRNGLGGKFRIILSGGAALDPRLNRFFSHIKFPIYEGWGLTEGSTPIVNQPGKTKIGTIGIPLPGVEVKLGNDGEVLIRSPMNMVGYYRNPASTEQAIDKEGWLHTGDKGIVDSEGFYKLIGRIKEQFKLSSGEYIAPVRIEQTLKQSPLVDMAMVIGDKKKFAACLIFPDFEVVKRMKQENNMEHMSDEDFLNSPVVKEEMNKAIELANKSLNNWEHIYQYRFVVNKPTIESGELTPTLKIKRDVVLDHYRDLINTIYQEE